MLPGGKDEAQRLDAGGLAASIATLLFSLPALGATHASVLQTSIKALDESSSTLFFCNRVACIATELPVLL